MLRFHLKDHGSSLRIELHCMPLLLNLVFSIRKSNLHLFIRSCAARFVAELYLMFVAMKFDSVESGGMFRVQMLAHGIPFCSSRHL